MEEKKIVPILIVGIIGTTAMLSGCIHPGPSFDPRVVRASALNDERTAVELVCLIVYDLMKPNYRLAEAFVMYDVTTHDNWRDYVNYSEAKSQRFLFPFRIIEFHVELDDLNPNTTYYCRPGGEYHDEFSSSKEYLIGGDFSFRPIDL